MHFEYTGDLFKKLISIAFAYIFFSKSVFTYSNSKLPN